MRPWSPDGDGDGELLAHVRARGHLHLFTDFDGTISAFTPTPEAAELSDRARAALVGLVARPDTDVVIVSGRPVETLAAKVAVDGIAYVGNHGMDTLVEGRRFEDPTATRARPAVARLGPRFVALAASLPGPVLEQKGISLSLHTRLVTDDAAREALERAAGLLAATEPELETFRGKKIVEVRPRGAPHKGAATLRVLRAAHGDGWDQACCALFLGDDVTDEDAFRALAGRGFGVRVTDEPTLASAARYRARSVEDAIDLLWALASR